MYHKLWYISKHVPHVPHVPHFVVQMFRFSSFLGFAPFFIYGRVQLDTLPQIHTNFQSQWNNFSKSYIINEMTVNIIFCIHIWYLHTLPNLPTKFQAQRTRFDKSCIINEMTVNIIVFIHIWYLHTLPITHTNFQLILMTLSFGLFFGTPLEE